MTNEQVVAGLDAIELLARRDAESEFDTVIWPNLSQKYLSQKYHVAKAAGKYIAEFQPLLRLMYVEGASVGALAVVEVILKGKLGL